MSGKKIGIVLALDGERAFSQSAQNARKETANLKSELRKLTTEYDGNANSQEFLSKKQENLIQQTETYTKTLKNAKAALENARNVQKQAAQRYEELKKSLEEARKEQEKMISAGREGSKECREQEKKVAALEQAVEKQGLQCQKCEGKVSDWSKRVNDAENDLEKANRALKKNTTYLEEAENASDKCATSINKFGKEAQGATETISGWGEKLEDAFANKMMSTGIDILIDGANAVKDAMLDASAASAQLTASTGLSERAAKRYEAVMKQIRGDNFGQDYQDVADVMSQTIQIMGELDDSAMSGVVEGAITLRDTFDMDVNESIRAVDVMMKTMGVDAETAFDLLAKGAQNGLDRSHELADNLTEYGSLWGQAGFSASEAFAIMDNGLQSGAYNLDKVNDFVKEFGISLSDGRIGENIGSFSEESQELFDKWQKGEATTSQVFYSIIGDLEKMTNKQDALTLASNIWSALGEDNAMQVLTSLNDVNDAYENVNGTMEKLQQTKYSDLESAVGGLGAAIQENLVTPLADLALPGITALAQGATDVINGIGEAITPQKTELQTFIEEIEASNEEVSSLIQNAQETVNGANADVANLEAYKQVLLDLNEQEKLSEFQKYQLKNAVETLGDSVPGLADAFDSETGTLTATNEQLEKMFENAEAVAMQNALIQAQTELYEANAQALINKAKADSAAEEATKARIEIEEKNQESMMETGDTYGKYYSEYMDAVVAEDKAAKAQKEAGEAAEEANEELTTQTAALEDLNKEYGLTSDSATEMTDAVSDTAEAVQNVGTAAAETSVTLDKYGNDITGMTEEAAAAVTEATGQIIEDYGNMRDGIADAIENSVSFFDEFSGGTEVTADQIKANLDSQIDGIQNWSENMQTLAGEVGDGMSQEMFDALAEMGPESANLVQTLVDALNSGTGDFEEIAGKWAEAMELKDQSGVIADYTSVGKELTQNLATSISNSTQVVTDAASKLMESVEEAIGTASEGLGEAIVISPDGILQKLDEYRDAGEQLGKSAAEGIMSTSDEIDKALSPDAGGLEGKSGEYEAAGKSLGKAFAGGLDSSTEEAGQSGTQLAQAGAQAIQEQLNSMQTAGEKNAKAFTSGLGSGKSQANASGSSLGSAAKNGASGETGGFYSVGFNMASGVASGIGGGQWQAVSAAANMAASALSAAKTALGIHSPSKVFRDQVGKQITEGMAFGIRKNTSTATAATEKMSRDVLTKATLWLSVYKKAQKKKNKISLDDEKWYWTQVRRTVKSGTAAYHDATAKMIAAGVSRTKTTGSGKRKKTVKKDTETYYSDVYQAAETYLSKLESLNDVSARNQLSYWNSMAKQLKKGTTAWYDAQSKIKSLKEKIGTVSNMSDLLSAYQTYYNMSEKAEMQYWDIIRRRFTQGTEERLEADEKYLDAREKYTDKLKELEDDYKEKVEEVNKKLKDDIADLTDQYKSELEDRTKSIRDAFGLFDEFTSESADGKTLLFNIQAQAAGYEDWMKQIEELSGKGILNQDLLDELTEQGPEISAAIHALNSLTEEELKEYNEAYLKKMQLSTEQAKKDTGDLKKEMDNQIKKLNAQAAKDKADLKKNRDAAVAKVNTSITSSMKSLASQVKTIADDQTAKLVNAITGEKRKQGAERTQDPKPASSSAGKKSTTSSSGKTSSSSSGKSSSSSTAAKKDKILSIIQSGKKRGKLSSSERKKHAALYNYLADHYGRAGSNTLYKKLASALGVKTKKTVTSSQKNAILKALKKKGYSQGGKTQDGLTWMDEELSSKGPEMIVRKSDNAILTRTRPGDEIINADTAANLAQIGKYSLAELKQMVQEQGAAAYLKNLHIPSGMARMNQLMDIGSREYRSQNMDVRKMEQALIQMNSLMEECLPYIRRIGQNQVVTLDGDAIVGRTEERMGNALAMRTRRRRT